MQWKVNSRGRTLVPEHSPPACMKVGSTRCACDGDADDGCGRRYSQGSHSGHDGSLTQPRCSDPLPAVSVSTLQCLPSCYSRFRWHMTHRGK